MDVGDRVRSKATRRRRSSTTASCSSPRRATRCWRSTPRRATCCGASSGRSRRTCCCCIRPAAASRCSATRSISPRPMRCSSRSTPRPARRSGKPRSRTTSTATTCRWRRWSPTARSWSASRAASSASAALSRRSTPRPASRLWKTYTVPAPGEPGSETWPKGDQWKTGGGSVWITGNYDPETNLTFWGTGNGGPWMGDQRPGRQSLHLVDHRPRCRDRQDQGLSPVPSRTIRGTGTRSRRRSSSITSAMARPSKVSSMSRATAICGCSSAPPTRSTSSTASPS